MEKIRNFSIIAHIDHGKTTLSDRLLEITNTVEKRKMHEQMLDVMELERERGITIKMQPVTMTYKNEYIFNLIDTPGHIDFSYEVSRSLFAVDGALLLVDSTQGVQAQTLSVLKYVNKQNLAIIPVLSKVDSPLARVEEVSKEMCNILNCKNEDIVETSGKTGLGIEKLMERIISNIPPPRPDDKKGPRALIFDYSYSGHTGMIAYVRVFDGEFKKGDSLYLTSGKEKFICQDIGILSPSKISRKSIKTGEIGYITTGIKNPKSALVGDTISLQNGRKDAFKGYMKPLSVVWASIFPKDAAEFTILNKALDELSLSDSSLSYQEESSLALGKGFRCGFLGMLHIEIITERIRREYNIEIIITSPTVDYTLQEKGKEKYIVTNPAKFPENVKGVIIQEPWVELEIFTPEKYFSALIQLFMEYEVNFIDSKNIGGDRTQIRAEMPLRELVRNFFDNLENISSGYASFSYKRIGERSASVVRLDVFIAEKLFPAFSQIVSKRRVEKCAKKLSQTVANNIPRAMFTFKVQVVSEGKIISSKGISAMRKDVTAKLYGGDVTRRMKLLEKQKKGKAKMKNIGVVNVPHKVFLKILKDQNSL